MILVLIGSSHDSPQIHPTRAPGLARANGRLHGVGPAEMRTAQLCGFTVDGSREREMCTSAEARY
jgi:hypothetical protein